MPDDVDDGRLLQSWIAMAKEARGCSSFWHESPFPKW